MSDDQKIQYINSYNKNATTTVLIRLNYKTDRDIIDKLSAVPSKMGYIKQLIRDDLNK